MFLKHTVRTAIPTAILNRHFEAEFFLQVVRGVQQDVSAFPS
jgi:hypothetical protein